MKGDPESVIRFLFSVCAGYLGGAIGDEETRALLEEALSAGAAARAVPELAEHVNRNLEAIVAVRSMMPKKART